MQLHLKQFSNEAAFIFVISNPLQTDTSVKYSKPDLGIARKAITFVGAVAMSDCCLLTNARSEFLYLFCQRPVGTCVVTSLPTTL